MVINGFFARKERIERFSTVSIRVNEFAHRKNKRFKLVGKILCSSTGFKEFVKIHDSSAAVRLFCFTLTPNSRQLIA